MEDTTVLIVGAGPSGLALGALLGRMNVKVKPYGCSLGDMGVGRY